MEKEKENNMAENNNGAPAKVDMSAVAFGLAKDAGLVDDKAKFEQFEKNFVKKFYETIGLSDIPDEFLNLTKFLDAYSGVLVKSVQSELAIMNLTKRLSMYKLSENIQATADKGAAPAPSDVDEKPTGHAPTAK